MPVSWRLMADDGPFSGQVRTLAETGKCSSALRLELKHIAKAVLSNIYKFNFRPWFKPGPAQPAHTSGPEIDYPARGAGAVSLSTHKLAVLLI